MTIRARIAKLFGFPTPADGVAPGWPEHQLFSPYQLNALALDYPKAVRKVATVRACVLRIANDLAQLPIVFERQRGEDWEALPRTTGNVVDVWNKANDTQTSFELRRDLAAHLKASGDAYLVAETFGAKKVLELWLMPPQYVRVIPGRRRSEVAYVFNRGGREEAIPGENVIHFKSYNPDFEPTGASDLESVELQYATRHDIARLMQLFVRGGGMPAGFFRAVSADGKPSAMAMPEPEQKKHIAALERVFGGIRNAFRPRILSQMDFVKMGLTPNEMALIEQSRLTDEDICRALGVPPWMVGIKDSGNLGGSTGSASADRGIYVRNTLLPEVAQFDSLMTERFCPMFETGVRARTDLSGLTELHAPLLNAATQLSALTGGPVLTVNETRKMFGLPPDPAPESNTLRKPAQPFGGLSDPAPADAKPAAEPAPAPTETKKARMIDGDEAREERRRRAAANLARYERRATRLFADLLERQMDRIIARIRQADETGTLRALRQDAGKRAIGIDDLLQPDPEDRDALQRLLEQLVRDRGEEALADIGLQLTLDVMSGRAASFVTSQAQRALALIDATTREAVRREIAAGLSLNESVGQIVERIRQMPEFGQSRALMIARTETVSAYNFAAVDAYEQAGDVVEGVEWLSARDQAVRPTHSEADGQVVPVGTPFTVGGAAMSFPGDPGGPPDETINCRCTAAPVVNEKARARRVFQSYLGRVLRGEGAIR